MANKELRNEQKRIIDENSNGKSIIAKERMAADSNGRIIIQIPEFKDQKSLKSIDHFQTWDGKPAFPEGTKGYIFINEVDSKDLQGQKIKQEQAVQADGSGIIIINNVQPKDVKKINKLLSELEPFKSNSTLFFNKLTEVLEKIKNDFGYGDKYNSDISYLQENLLLNKDNGLNYKSTKVKAYLATKDVFLPNDNGTFIVNPEFSKKVSSAAAAFHGDGLNINQLKEMVRKRFPDLKEELQGQMVSKGDIIVIQNEGKDKELIHKIDGETFFKQYRHSDGSTINEQDFEKDKIDNNKNNTPKAPGN